MTAPAVGDDLDLVASPPVSSSQVTKRPDASAFATTNPRPRVATNDGEEPLSSYQSAGRKSTGREAPHRRSKPSFDFIDAPVGFAGGLDEEPADGDAVEFSYAARIVVVAERAVLAMLAALVACAMLATRSNSLPVHPLALAMWATGASITAVALAALTTDPDAHIAHVGRRRAVGTILLVSLIACVSGIVAAADGVAGPAWVLFMPLVIIVGAVLGAAPGLATGALAAGGVYVAAALSNTLNTAGIGRLVILLPAFPAVGLAAGSLCGAVHRAAIAAREQRSALQRDVVALTQMLDAIGSGDLTGEYGGQLTRPAWSDPSTERLAVVLADTLIALRRLVGRLSGAGSELVRAVDELAATATTHVDAVETQAVAVTETTSTIEQLAATATAIADTSTRVSVAAAGSRRDAEYGFIAVAASSEAIRRLATRTSGLAVRAAALGGLVEQVSDTTRVMDELARRTTMLALSAAIEAASAGERSSGFANVAGEVRALAERARAATGRIGAIVSDLRTEVEATAQAAGQGTLAVSAGLACHNQVEAALDRIRAMIDETADAAREITTATDQQRAAADDVVAAMNSVTASSAQARIATSRHSDSAERLRDLSRSVADVIATFRLPTSMTAGAGPSGESS